MSDSSSDYYDSDAESEEAQPEYDIVRLLHLARLLTSDDKFLTNSRDDAEKLLNLATAPSCDADTGDFVDLLAQMSSDPPTYTGEDPIQDIITTLQQLASCQKSPTRSLLSKIGDFFMQRDGGKALRQILLLSKVIIECLSLWYVAKENNMIGDDITSMQNFCKSALAAHTVELGDRNLLPVAIANQVQASEQWDRSLSTIAETFKLGDQYPAPVLLIFNKEALEATMNATEQTGKLPPQVASGTEFDDNGESSQLSTLPVTFVPHKLLHTFVEEYLGSGNVKELPPSE